MTKIYTFGLFGLIIILLGIPAPALSQHGSKNLELHIHPSLTLIMNGREITLPGLIGIDPNLWVKSSLDRYSDAPLFRAPIHTHEDNDTLHVESTVFRRFTFGDFLNVWGIDQSKITSITLDGKELNDTYNEIPLENRQNWTLEINLETSPKNFAPFAHSKFGLAFQYPSEWNLDVIEASLSRSGVVGEKFLGNISLSPPESGYLDTPYFFMEVDKLPSNNVTLDNYTMKNLPQRLKANEERFPIITQSTAYNFNGNPAHKLELEKNNIYVNESMHPPRAYESKFQKYMYIWTISNGKVYIAIYRGYSHAFSEYFPTIEKILNSIRLG